MIIKSYGEDSYFVASNSKNGFCSYYQECFDDKRIHRVYAIKGGPGTGKSRFMRDVATCAKQNGRSVEYIYCSSDPDSLDGIILTHGKESIALLDATAPHVYEPSNPGTREEFVNLGNFWRTADLVNCSDRIKRLNDEKKVAYCHAYHYLKCAGEMAQVRDDLVAPFLRFDVMEKFAERLLNGVEDGTQFSLTPALISSVGMRGEVCLDTYFSQAKKLFLVEDCRGSAQYLMKALLSVAQQKALCVRVSYDPVLPNCIDGLFLTESRISFVVASVEDLSYPHKRISMRRFVDLSGMKEIREDLNYAERMRRALLEGAIAYFEKVRNSHFELEEIYSAAMDFAAKEDFTKKFCKCLFDLQNG